MRRRLALLLAAAGFLALAGCGAGHRAGSPPESTGPVDSTTGNPAAGNPAAGSPAAGDLGRRAAAAAGTAFRASYAARATAGRTATVSVFIASRDRFRVDVTEPGSTASLFGTPTGSVACTSRTGVKVACFLVAAPGQPVPAQFDAGIQRVFGVDLPVLAVNAAAFTVRPAADLPAAGMLAAARCFVLTGSAGGPPLTRDLAGQVDLGTYCLTETGLPRSLTFASGTLSLTGVGGPPGAAALRPPAVAKPLPGGGATPAG